MSLLERTADAVVVGGGNAGLSAAITVAEAGNHVVLLEAAAERDRGGNSTFTGGGVRYVHSGTADIIELIPEMADGADTIVAAPYTAELYVDDLGRDSGYLADGDNVEILVDSSRDAVRWWHDRGVRFNWSLGRHSFEVDGKYEFPPGICTNITGAGAGLIETLYSVAKARGVEVRYASTFRNFELDDTGGIAGLVFIDGSGQQGHISTKNIVLACGGFESNPAMRAQYLGPRWDLARVRGTRYNTGAGLAAALDAGAEPFGNWSGCHAVASDANTPLFGEREVGDLFARHSYPFGIVVNIGGMRILDEGADFQSRTYAKYGAQVLGQPGLTAFQIFDSVGEKFLRAEYKHRRTTRFTANSIPELAASMGIDPDRLVETVEEYNAAVSRADGFDPNALDGVGTQGLPVPKSNWALPIESPPFQAFPVTTAITFTFGGLHVDREAAVLRVDGSAIPGLYAAGEIVGGLFYHNYGSGTGLVSGTVFGRRAGISVNSRLNPTGAS